MWAILKKIEILKLYIIWFVNIKNKIMKTDPKKPLSNIGLFFEIILTNIFEFLYSIILFNCNY